MTRIQKTKMSPKKIISTFIVAGFSLFLIIFIIFKTKAISSGISLSIEGIENGSMYTESVTEITGNADNAKHLLINGREINISQEGDFKDFLVLAPGYNIITISAEDKFGKITKKTYEVIKKEV